MAVGQGTRRLHVGSTRAHSRAQRRSAREASSRQSARCSRTVATTVPAQQSPASTHVLRRTAAGVYEEIPVKYSSSVSGGKGNTNVPVRPGDILVVP